MAVTMKNAVSWNVEPCRSCVNLRLGGTYRLHHQGRKIRERRTKKSRWLQTEFSLPPHLRTKQIQFPKRRVFYFFKYCITISLLYGSIATCFDPAG
jgi:hypothetical protein